MDKIYRIAIDGPAGAGKSTMAKILAKRLGIDYIDTGAMYRAIAVKLIRTGTDYDDPEALAKMLASTDVDYYGGKVYLDGEDVSSIIRTPEVSDMASKSSAVPAVRDKLGETQMAIAKKRSLLMDGRDIGTIIIPDAEFKFYLTASSRIRAYRRVCEMKDKGIECDLDSVEQDIKERDYRDSHRDYHPLKKADDAVEIDTSDLTIAEVVDKMLEIINEKVS
ncbi:MAG: (d)CMP kinase [Firmicutes bacterium]|nr:(d)CMP kinase [Bacillota bacterium]MBR0481648.1 (d)CMP kinase [Bacillota bacterium]